MVLNWVLIFVYRLFWIIEKVDRIFNNEFVCKKEVICSGIVSCLVFVFLMV